MGPAESKTPSMYRNITNENREASGPFVVGRTRTAGRRRRAIKAQMNGSVESYSGIVCAEQRVDREGPSPSGARMRSAVSKSGGNSSLAGKSGRYGEV